MILEITRPTIAPADADRARAELGWERLFSRSDIGFHQLPERRDLWRSAAARGSEIARRYQRLALLGIGGSSLGPLAIREALVSATERERLVLFDNVDARSFWEKIEMFPDLRDVHFLIVSKSGSTMETLANAEFAAQVLKARGLSLKDQATVVSETRANPLTEWARSVDVPILEVPLDVGGRFSVLTPVGLIPAAFFGMDIEAFRVGADAALAEKKLVVELAAQGLSSFAREEWITLFWAYSERLKVFGAWLQQLWAESLAKRARTDGRPAPRVSSPFVCLGANDQHSILQQVAEGARDKYIWFFRESDAEEFGPALDESQFGGMEMLKGKNLGRLLAAEAEATQRALAEVGVHSLTLKIPHLDESSLGGLFMLFELVVATMGEALGINTFDQPGVEAGKKLARQIMAN